MDDRMAESNIERVKRIEAICRERGPALRRHLASLLPDPLAEQAHALVMRIQHLIEHEGDDGADSAGEQTDDIEPVPTLL